MRGIGAIETSYHGYRFRSRLEAKWAVYFDTIGIKWEYEREGFDLDVVGKYLPDFWFPEAEFWAEVKPKVFTDDERKKVIALGDFTKCRAVMLIGMPECKAYWCYDPRTNGQRSLFALQDNTYLASVSWLEDKLGKREYLVPGVVVNTHLVLRGVKAAKSKRFEFGERE